MKSIRSIITGLGLFALPVMLSAQSFSTETTASNNTGSPDSIVRLTAEAQGLEPIAPASLPPFGTFWVVGSNGFAAPYPCLPKDSISPIYAMADGQFLVDGTDGQVSLNPRQTNATVEAALAAQAASVMALIEEVQTPKVQRQARTMSLNGPTPPGAGDGTNVYYPNDNSYTPPDYGTNLWIAQVAITNGYLAGVASNTLADVSYEILTNADLSTTNWGSTGLFVPGSETTNWTAFITLPVGRTNNLFFRLRSWASSDGSGLPDWWEQLYFGINGVDPFGSPAGDGWNNLQKFKNGWNPNVFYTPPAPQGLTVSYNVNINTATLNWLPSPGPVTGYTITDSANNSYQVSAGTTTFQNIVAPTVGSYSLTANYAQGNSAASSISLHPEPPNYAFINGRQGHVNLMLFNPPPDLSDVQIHRVSQQGSDGTVQAWPDVGSSPNYPNDLADGDFVIPASSFTNGMAQIPASQIFNFGLYYFYVQTDRSNGLSSAVWNGATGYANNNVFVDGRRQLKDNLIFRLRAATDNGPFEIFQALEPTNYVYAGFYRRNDAGLLFRAILPFEENNLFRNFVYDANNLLTTNIETYEENGQPETSAYIGMPNTGAFYEYAFDTIEINEWDSYFVHANIGLVDIPAWQADLSSFITTNGLPSAPVSGLAGSLSQWILPAYDGMIYFWLYPGYQNFYGLTCQSQLSVVYTNNQFIAYTQTTGANPPGSPAMAYFNSAQPIFQTDSYYFARPGINPLPEEGYNIRPSPFSPTNTTPLLLAGVGDSLTVAGYAKLAVQNGYSGVYGYLGQYFDQAYKMTNGVVTTNPTGILSPYGNFFATEPGPVALVTMPDIDTGERGTGTVYAVSLQVDKNHDGIMDSTWNGPDATSPASPMVCWVNNGYIKPGSDGSLDQDLPLPLNDEKNANYAQGKITCQRDLENIFRLWISGVPQLPSAQGYTLTMNMAALSGDPAINLYLSSDSAGGTGYLTDTNVAADQARTDLSPNPAFGIALATINSQQSFTLPANFFDYNYPYYSRFLFEGAGIGEGQLRLTISQNGNVLAQTSVYLDLHDIKDLYEQADAANVTEGFPPSSLISQYRIDHVTDQQPDETKQIVVFVHGINNSAQDYYDSTDLIFKRLYWSGYHGKVAGFRWPCAYLPPDTVVNPLDYLKAFNYNRGEFYAWKSASALKDYLCYLTNRLAGYQIDILAHSQGNIVASEAAKQGAPFDNFILTQAAVPAQCYDTGVPFQQKFLDAETNSPTPFYTTNGGYHGYFTSLAGNVINFYNTNDYALRTGTYFGAQANWEEDQISRKPENFILLGGPEYTYYSSSGITVRTILSDETVTDPQEIMSMVARSRSHALGAEEDVHGVINADRSVDLVATFGFGKTRDDHSAQFKWPVQRALGYYQIILNRIQPAQ